MIIRACINVLYKLFVTSCNAFSCAFSTLYNNPIPLRSFNFHQLQILKISRIVSFESQVSPIATWQSISLGNSPWSLSTARLAIVLAHETKWADFPFRTYGTIRPRSTVATRSPRPFVSKQITNWTAVKSGDEVSESLFRVLVRPGRLATAIRPAPY